VKRSISNKKIYYLLGIILFVVFWQVLAMIIDQQKMIFPGPYVSLQYALKLLTREYTYRCIRATFLKALCGYAISFVIALLLGVIAGNFEVFEQLMKPTVTVLRAIPTASLIYLFIALAGFRNAPVLLVIVISFPIIYEGVVAGIRNISKSIKGALLVDGADLLRSNIRVRLPLAVPYIVVAMANSFSLSFKIEIMAEVITGASSAGLGSALLAARANDPSNMVPIFAYSLIALFLILLIDFICSFIANKLTDNVL